jgi:putative RecB family exonuclease
MVYPISATKLRTYQRCAYSYYLRYEKRVANGQGYGAAALGAALHQTLAKCHRDWHYHEAIPDRRWFHRCWDQHSQGLTLQQVREGRSILDGYYDRFVATEPALRQPMAIDGKIQAKLQIENLEFQVVGRYDRLDFLPNGLELIDYKSAKDVKLPEVEELDLQMGLYAFALEQTYQQRLRYLTLLFLRTGERVRYRVTQRHQRQAVQMISQLATQLRHAKNWEANPGSHCSSCSFSCYCAAANHQPIALPITEPLKNLQLAFGFN